MAELLSRKARKERNVFFLCVHLRDFFLPLLVELRRLENLTLLRVSSLLQQQKL